MFTSSLCNKDYPLGSKPICDCSELDAAVLLLELTSSDCNIHSGLQIETGTSIVFSWFIDIYKLLPLVVWCRW